MADIANVALLVRLEAMPGRKAEVAEQLRGVVSIIEGEPSTTTWFAVRFGPTSFGNFDTFPDEDARRALLVAQPDIVEVDVLASKLPQ